MQGILPLSWRNILISSLTLGLLLFWCSLTYRLKTGLQFTPQSVYDQIPTLDSLLFTAGEGEVVQPSKPPSPTSSPTPLAIPPKKGVLMMMKTYGRTSNNRIQVSEGLGLSLLLGRDLVIPDMDLNEVYKWEELNANLKDFKVNTRLVEDAPYSCRDATVYSIGGPYFGMGNGWDWNSWNAVPANFKHWGARESTFLTNGGMNVKDLYPRRHDFKKGGDNFTDEWGVFHSPPETDFGGLHKWWPYDLFVSPGFSRQNWGMLTFPNLVPVLEELADVECLIIDNPFFALDWRKYPRTFRRVWQVLEPASHFKLESDSYVATTLKGENFLAIHARTSDMCHNGCLHLKDDLLAIANETLSAPQCLNMSRVYFFSDRPLSGIEEGLSTLFPFVKTSFGGKGVFDQEVGVRATCFIGNPNSTFTGMIRLRRQIIAHKSPDTEWTYTAS